MNEQEQTEWIEKYSAKIYLPREYGPPSCGHEFRIAIPNPWNRHYYIIGCADSLSECIAECMNGLEYWGKNEN